ncbi:ATP-dependent DNA helicase [Aphis craccivora]|uniref:ATP-dependent DNA helicase n=1 Tax=Aphis craccivora TaxID=307492 RepID=A0A6G0ZG46_APHCR|nr:ATP-dependent DNA helicase [Aphis craccivora]
MAFLRALQLTEQISVKKLADNYDLTAMFCTRKRKGADLSRSTSKARNLQNNRSERTEEQIQQQNTDARVRMAQLHQEEPEDTRSERNEVHRAFISDSFPRLAFQYKPDIEYYAHSKVVIGAMDKECPHCHALKFKNESAGMCCASGKVQLPEIETPPEPGNYLYGKTTFAGQLVNV